MASLAFTLCNRRESGLCHGRMERRDRADGRHMHGILSGGCGVAVHPAGPHASARIVWRAVTKEPITKRGQALAWRARGELLSGW